MRGRHPTMNDTREPESDAADGTGPQRPPRNPSGDGYIYGERTPIGTPDVGEEVAVHYEAPDEEGGQSVTMRVIDVRVLPEGRLVIQGLLPNPAGGQPTRLSVGIPPAVYTLRRGDEDMWFGIVDMADLEAAGFEATDAGRVVRTHRPVERTRLGEFRGLTTPEGEEVAP
jgi:hypothetical protein